MTRLLWTSAAVSGLALLGACAGQSADDAPVAAAAAAPALQAQPQQPVAPPPQTTTGAFTDAQVQSFAAASFEIDPINRQLATATPEQRTQAAEQIRAILTRNNLDGATYNAIATAAQSDQALSARIAAARAAQPAPQAPGE